MTNSNTLGIMYEIIKQVHGTSSSIQKFQEKWRQKSLYHKSVAIQAFFFYCQLEHPTSHIETLYPAETGFEYNYHTTELCARRSFENLPYRL
jgi:hypothetical protein